MQSQYTNSKKFSDEPHDEVAHAVAETRRVLRATPTSKKARNRT